MIVVFEGCDNSGKTTAALAMAKALRAAFLKVERPSTGLDLLAFQNILEVARAYSGVVVVDRHVAISEPIYGNTVRGGHQLRPSDIGLCLSRITHIVYCRPPSNRIMETIGEREQMRGVLANARQIIEAYDHYFKDADPKLVHRYDYTATPTIDHLLQEIKR
jgi:hypothetical protein